MKCGLLHVPVVECGHNFSRNDSFLVEVNENNYKTLHFSFFTSNQVIERSPKANTVLLAFTTHCRALIR